MKKYFMLALVGLFSFGTMVSCDDRNDDVLVQDNDTYSVVLDINNVDFTMEPGNMQSGTIIRSFTQPLVGTDVVLIYRKAGTAQDGSPVWQSIPRSVYFEDNILDYDFDFSKNDIHIYADGNYNLSTVPEYVKSQTFRVVLVPASAGAKNANVDYTDYQSVIKFYKINDSKVKTL